VRYELSMVWWCGGLLFPGSAVAQVAAEGESEGEATIAPPSDEPTSEPALDAPLEHPEDRAEEPAEAPVAVGDPAPVEPSTAEVRESLERVLATADEEPTPEMVFWQNDEGWYIKPVLQLASNVVLYVPSSDVDDDLALRASTLALARFGLEGELFGFLSFRSVFERNIGFSLARNGPVGTSVWEGTASLQARENYLRFERWGLSLTGGIFVDPASNDYISSNVLDSFGMDPYVRDALLVSGASQGQGVMVRYVWRWFTAGLSASGGNPLTTSLSYGFGGSVSALGTLFSAPLRALSNGIPGSDIQLNTLSPSLTFEHDAFDAKLAAQLYLVDVDATADEDATLFGYNLRATAQVKILEEMFRVFGSFAYRRNEQISLTDLSMQLPDEFEGVLVGAGADFTYGPFSIGGQYYWMESTVSDETTLRAQYLNFGATYWLEPKHVSIGLRYARSMADAAPTPPILGATDSFILSMRLVL
jgi:hypothetical protein